MDSNRRGESMVDFKNTTEVQYARVKLLENQRWYEENLNELQKNYDGKMIAIKDKKVVIVASNEDELDKLIEERGYSLDETLRVLVSSEPIPEIVYPGPPRKKTESSLF
jgi:hypothetical protein